MSRIGKRKLQIPTGVEAVMNGDVLTVKSSKGSLTLNIDPLIEVVIADGVESLFVFQRRRNSAFSR